MILHQKHQEKQEYPKPVSLDVVEMKDYIQEVSFGNTLEIETALKRTVIFFILIKKTRGNSRYN